MKIYLFIIKITLRACPDRACIHVFPVEKNNSKIGKFTISRSCSH